MSESNLAVAYELPFIQQGDSLLIDARLLHRQLKSGYQFSNWIQSRITDYEFKANEDFFAKEISLAKRGGHNRVDYLLTLDMAKELAMLERNEVGRQIRRYFIQKEKEARGVSVLPKESGLFKGLKARHINDREMYPYREILVRAGYKANSNSNRRHRYWMHFVKEGSILFITKEFALHLHHQKQVYNNRKTMLASVPVLPFNFGAEIAVSRNERNDYATKTKGGAPCR